MLAERAVLTIRSDRRYHPPYGLVGGDAGRAVREHARSSDGSERDAAAHADGSDRASDAAIASATVSAGGGGYGCPLERDPAAVLEDVLDGKVSVEAARELYGVVARREPPTVDVDETATAPCGEPDA